jgi:hypothetical protein
MRQVDGLDSFLAIRKLELIDSHDFLSDLGKKRKSTVKTCRNSWVNFDE